VFECGVAVVAVIVDGGNVLCGPDLFCCAVTVNMRAFERIAED